MNKYIIDAHLPYYFSIWHSSEYIHVRDLDATWTDEQIWEYARKHNLTIVTKDADFSDKILLHDPPPRVIQIKLGNMKMREFHTIIARIWEDVCKLSQKYRLIHIFKDRIECID